MLFRSEEHTSELQSHSHLVCSSDRKSTRLNSSHTLISYAVFCLKKKKKTRHASTVHRSTYAVAHASPAVLYAQCAGQQTPGDRSSFFLLSILVFFFLNNRGPPEFYPFPQPAAFPI